MVVVSQARIQKLGGHVLHRNGVRVMGALAMSRAIGDHALRPYGELTSCLCVLTDNNMLMWS